MTDTQHNPLPREKRGLFQSNLHLEEGFAFSCRSGGDG